MNKEEIGYLPFETVVLRTPFFSFQEFQKNLNLLNEDENFWKEFLQNTCLQEALFLASPILFDEIIKFLNGQLNNSKDIKQLKMSVMRYYTRMSTRCTPFGLFAGFSIGKLGNKTCIELGDSLHSKRYTRLDMNYLCNLAQEVCKMPNIRSALKYYPNTSNYFIGNKLRYIEYHYDAAKRIHFAASVDSSEYLQIVLDKARMGGKIQDLAISLVDNDINMDDATAFINDLIDNQILVSELEPEVTGKNFLLQLESILKFISKDELLNEKILELNQLLKKIDTEIIGDSLPFYSLIESIVKELKIAYDPNFLFQTDMFKLAKDLVLDSRIVGEILDAIDLINKLTLPSPDTLLTKFTEIFRDRYETMEIPLLEVLDVEIGIGHLFSKSVDVSPLLDGYRFPEQQNNINLQWDLVQSFLHKKYLEANKNKTYNVDIQDSDVKHFQSNWSDLPPTFSCMCEIFSENSTPSVYIRSIGGSSAANLFGRFCHVTEELESYVKEITSYEQLLNPDVLYAEIVHLPESRIGNILFRPILRPYEIPYLAKSAVGMENQISLSDLYISLQGNQIVLRSRRLNKQVIPRMSTAHNFSFNSMPVYHFLCAMQTQNLRGALGFAWGVLQNEYDFLPRVTYKNVILSLAKWVVKGEDFFTMINQKEKKDILEDINKWRMDKKISQYVVLADGDNTLFVDFENMLSIETLYSTVKKRKNFLLEELPLDLNQSIVKNNHGEILLNEFIFSFYKKEKV